MINSSTLSCGPCSTTGIPIQSLRFIPSADSKYIGIYAQNQCKEWMPLNIGLTSVPSLQQVRDVDRNISLNTGSYTNAHFYLRSAEGNNINTAFFTNKDGGGIQSGDSTGTYVPLNLQPLGGLLNYGGNEVATKIWTSGQGYLKTETDPTVPSYVKSISVADISNWNGKENTINKSTTVTLGTSDVLFPTQKAVKTYVDTSITNNNANYIPITQKGTANGVASLGADGKIPTAQVPSIAISDTFVVSSQAAMLALSAAQTGDIAVRTDVSQSFILTNNTPGTLSSWQQLLSPTVSSTDQVNEGATNLYFTPARARAAISVTGNGSYNSTTGVINVNAETDPVYTAAIPNILMVKTTIPTGADLNTYQTSGLYVQGSNTNAQAGTNYPVGGVCAGLLKVVASAGFVWQEYHTYNYSGSVLANKKFIRTFLSSWSVWKEISTVGNGDNILNQNVAAQASSNFWIDGTGKMKYLGVDAGTLGSLTPIATFAQNGGSVQISSGTSTSGQFIPTIRGIANVSNNSGIFIVGQGADTYSVAGVVLRTSNAGYTGAVTSGKIFSVQNHTTEYLSVAYNGVVNVPNQALGTTVTKALYTDVSGNLVNRTMSGMVLQGSIDFDTLKQVGEVAFINNATATNGAPQTGSYSHYLGFGGGDVAGRGVQMVVTADSNFYFRSITSATAPVSSLGWIKVASENYVSTSAILNQTAIVESKNYRINGYGQIGSLYVGGANSNGWVASVVDSKPMTGGTSVYGFVKDSIIQSDVTATAGYYRTSAQVAAGTFTLGSLVHFQAVQSTIGAGATVTAQTGFLVTSTLTGAGTNYGFRSQIISNGTSNWNAYFDGTAPNYMAGALGIGSTALTNTSLRVSKPITGSVGSYGIISDGSIQADVTTQASYFRSAAATTAASFTLSNLAHFNAVQGTIGAGSAITTQSGFEVSNTLIGATNNYGFRSAIPAGANRYNLYMDGTASNYLAGRLGLGTTPAANVNLHNNLTITGSTVAYGNYVQSQVQSDVTSSAIYYASTSSTVATAFTLANLTHYQASQGVIGAGSIVTTQTGFNVLNNVVGGTSNYGFRGQISSSTYNWNIYMDGTAQNWLKGNLAIGVSPAASNLLYVDAGTVNTATPIAVFAQNSGNISIGSSSSTSGEFSPFIKGVASVNANTGLSLMGAGFASYTQSAVQIKGANALGTGIVTAGKVLSVLNYATELMNIDYLGATTFATLAGTGTRMVVVDSTGKLSSQTISADTNFVNADLTATGSRIHMFGANSLAIAGTGWSIGGQSTGMFLQSTSGNGLLLAASNTNNNAAQIKTDLLTANRIFQLPNTAGTIALTTDVLNIYNSDGTLTSNRTLMAAGKDLTFTGFGTFKTYYDNTSYFTHTSSGFTFNKDNFQGSNYMTYGNLGMTIQSTSSVGYGSYQLFGNLMGVYIQGTGVNNAGITVTPTVLTLSVNTMGQVIMNNTGIALSDRTSAGAGSLSLQSNTAVTINGAGSYPVSFSTSSLTALRAVSWPDKAGTVALTSDLTTLNLQSVASVGNSYLGDLVLGTSGNQVFVGSGSVGSANTRLGQNTLIAATSGNFNTALGNSALGAMVGSDNNTAVGEGSLFAYKGITSAGANSAFGDGAGFNMTEGNDNLFLGVAAGSVGGTPMPGGNLNVFIGRSAGNFFGVSTSVTIGSRNVYIGQNAGYGSAYAPLSDKLLIGNNPTPGTSVHIIEGNMVQGAQSLKFNATVAVASLAGTGSRMVIADTAGNLSTQAIPSGTLTNFTAGALSPLFTTSVATATTTPALTFALTAAGANTYFGNNTAASASPLYTAMAALTAANDTNVTISLGGTPATSLFKAVSLTMGWSGTLAVARGGTGLSTAGSSGQILVSNGTGYALTTPSTLFIQNQNSAAQTANSWINGYVRADGGLGIGVAPNATTPINYLTNNNATVSANFLNNNSGTSAAMQLNLGTTSSALALGATSTAFTAGSGLLTANTGYLYHQTKLAFITDNASGYISFGVGASYPESFRIDTSGVKLIQSSGKFQMSDGSYLSGTNAGWQFFTSAAGALPIKVGGLVVSNSYANTAPANGIYVTGASYLVGGMYSNSIVSYTGTNINVMSTGQTFTVNAALYGVGGVYANNLFAYSGSTIGLGASGSSINVPSLAGTGNRMVIANTAGTLSTQAIPGTTDQWYDWGGYNYLGPIGPNSISGIDTNGGYASRYFEMTSNNTSLSEDVEFVGRWNDSSSPWTIHMPDPNQYPYRVMTIRNFAVQPNSYLILADHLPVFTSDGNTIGTLASLKYSSGVPCWIRIISQENVSTGNFEWRVYEYGFPLN